MSSAPQTIPLFLYFWLPAGKDAFGFPEWEKAPLCVQGDWHREIYRPISMHFAEQYETLSKSDRFKGSFAFRSKDTPKPALAVSDSKLNLREIRSEFFYKPSVKPDFTAAEEFNGVFHLLSSGLYVWQFDIPVSAGQLEPPASVESIERIKSFLKASFFEDVLVPLFDLHWQKLDAFRDNSGHLLLSRGSGKDVLPYSGALNYYQLELIYNYVFDSEVVPQLFFQKFKLKKEKEEEIRKKYTLRNIFSSIAMVSWGEPCRQYFPLGPARKSYSLRGPKESKQECYFVPGEIPWDETGSDRVLIEHFFSRLTFSAMEQFIRVTNTFGLMPYREGLEWTRKIVLLHSFRTKENTEPNQLYGESKIADWLSPEAIGKANVISPPSKKSLWKKLWPFSRSKDVAFKGKSPQPKLEEASPTGLSPILGTQSYAEIYYELIKSKLPSLWFLQRLLEDIAHVIAPTPAVQEKEYEGKKWIYEYLYSKATLDEALRQLKRIVGTIDNETGALRHLMERSSERQVLTELVETRKIQEFAAEDRTKVEIDPAQFDKFSLGLSILGGGFAISVALLEGGFWVLDHLLDKNNNVFLEILPVTPDSNFVIRFTIILFSVWAFIIVIALYFSKKTMGGAKLFQGPKRELCTSIFDYANLRHRISYTTLEEVIVDCNSKLLGLFVTGHTQVDCRIANLLSEMPHVGLEKRKYSFASEEQDHSSYTLHVEVEVHNPSLETYLTDIRLAIRTPPVKKGIEFEARRLVDFYVRELFKDQPLALVESILEKYFGISSPSTTMAAQKSK